MKNANSIGALIYFHRLIKNYSQLELAQQLHVTVSAVSSWERGINTPGVDIAIELADQMGITLDECFQFKTKKINQKNYTISNTISFEKAFFKIKTIDSFTDDQHNALIIRFNIWGVSLSKENINRELNVHFSVNDEEISNISKRIQVIEPMPINISPEFQKLPSLSKYYEVEYTLDYPFYQDLVLEIDYEGGVAKFEIPKSLLEIISKPSDALDDVVSIDLIETDVFKSALEYFANQDDLAKLQKFIVNQYKAFIKSLNAPKKLLLQSSEEDFNTLEKDCNSLTK